jgi:lipoic acid synthetase
LDRLQWGSLPQEDAMAPQELPVVNVPRTQALTPDAPPVVGPRPDWVKTRLQPNPNFYELKRLMREQGLHTICEEARCPNITECWGYRTASFLILGDICTRNCGFCSVTTGRPLTVDWGEPARLADAVARLGLQHIVVTSVDRDDLPDGGALVFAMTIRKLRERVPTCGIEVLTPDWQGNWDALKLVADARPDIYNHNVETVPRLYRRVRPKAVYAQSLELQRRAKALAPTLLTKSGLMVGLGETEDELLNVFADLRRQDVDILTVGQYLRPTLNHLVVERFYTPAEFARLKERAQALGFRHVESGPLVRSSYHAHEQVQHAAAAS